jgi:hypothetical protein
MERMRPSSLGNARLLVGWSEQIDLPDWGIRGLRAKMDTGARTSALHVEDVRELGGRSVRFDVIVNRRTPRRRSVTARIARRGRVRSSTGEYAERIFVTTCLRLGPIEREIEVSLVDRGEMLYRMLLGRSALSGLLIDTNHRGLLAHPRRAGTRRRS